MIPFSADRAMVAKFDAAIAPFMSKVGQMGEGVRKFQLMSQIGFREVDDRANRTAAALINLRSVAAGLGAAVGAGVGALASGAFISLSDKAKSLENQMRGIGAASEDTQRKIYALAIETRTPIEDTVGLLTRMQKSLQDQPLEKTITQVGTLNRLLAAGGLDGAARGSVALQFGQALQSGVLQGDELRSLREAAPYELLDAIAKAAGGTVEQLRDLGSEGKLTRDVMNKALDDLAQASKDKIGAFKMTVGEASDAMRTGLLAVVGQFDEGLGATEALAGMMQSLSKFMVENAEAGQVLGNALKVVAQTALLAAGARGITALGSAAVVANLQLASLAAMGARAAGVFKGLLGLMGGPVGLAIFALGASYMAYSANAEQVRERTKAVNAELERLGVISPQAADGIDETGKALDRLADPKRLAAIQALREEKERLEKGGLATWNPMSWFRTDADTVPGIRQRANNIAGGDWMFNAFEQRDVPAVREIGEMADAWERSQVSLADIESMAERIAAMDISAPAKMLAAELVEAARKAEQVDLGLTKSGEGERVLDGIKSKLGENLNLIEAIVEEMAKAGFPSEVTAEIIAMTQMLVEGKIEAGEVKAALGEIGKDHPAAAEYIARLTPIFAALGRLYALAAQTTAEMRLAAAGPISDDRAAAISEAKAGRLPVVKSDLAPTEGRATQPPKRAPSGIGGVDWGATPSSGGGGGGAARDDWADAVRSIKEETEALKSQAAAYDEVAASGKDYGNATDFARRKAELLQAAQRAGKAITPELRAEIDALALSYSMAGQSAEEAADKLQEAEDAGKRGAQAISDIFTSVLDGTASAKEAIASLLMEMAKIQMQKAVLGLTSGGGGGFFGWLGSALTSPFADGGIMTSAGPVGLPMRAYASGGIARSPQLALFGEGSTPEAYVPLPDGRSIPVTLRMPDLDAMDGLLRDRATVSQPQIVYVPQPYVVKVDADDDGKIIARMEQVSAATIAKESPRIVSRSVQATGAVMNRTKSFGGRR